MSKRFKVINFVFKLKSFFKIFYTVDIPTSQFHYEGDVLFVDAQETRSTRQSKLHYRSFFLLQLTTGTPADANRAFSGSFSSKEQCTIECQAGKLFCIVGTTATLALIYKIKETLAPWHGIADGLPHPLHGRVAPTYICTFDASLARE